MFLQFWQIIYDDFNLMTIKMPSDGGSDKQFCCRTLHTDLLRLWPLAGSLEGAALAAAMSGSPVI